MSVFDQPYMKEPGCNGCNINPDTFNYGRIDQDINQRKMTTEDKQKKEEIETLLSEAFNTLTFEEREKQQEALHGVDAEISEELNLIENALVELENHLLLLKNGSAYETAEQIDTQFVHDRAFRIMFLRAKRYDTKAAAYQILKFFEWKQQLFGTDKLTKDITIDDLDEDDIATLRAGSFQRAGKDRSGRVVLLRLLGLRACKTLQNELRSKYFIVMNLLKSEEAQLRGFVNVTYAVDDYRDSLNGAGFFEHVDLSNALPVHIASIHYCCSELSTYYICNLGVRAMPPKLRARFRLHFGSHLECQYRLKTFGIVGDNLPFISGTNKIDMKHHIKWCDAMLPMKGPLSVALKTTTAILEPHANDVVYKLGIKSNNGGNRHLRNLVVEWSQTYDNAKNETKRYVVNEIIDEIHGSGGRFLSQSDEGQVWVPIPVEDVRLKITQAFRNNRRKVRGSRRKRG